MYSGDVPRMVKFVIAMLLGLGLIGALEATFLPAQADVYGWKWNQTTITVSDQTHTQQAKAAVEAWDAVTPLDIHIVGGQTADIVIRWGNPTTEYGWDEAAGCTFDATGNPVHGEVVLDKKYKADKRLLKQYGTPLVLHGIGHTLGLAHTTDQTVASVMFHVMTSNWFVPQPYDIGQLALLYG